MSLMQTEKNLHFFQMIWAKNIISRGQWSRKGAKTAVEQCQRLDVRELKLKSGFSITVTYGIQPNSVTKNIRLDWTPCHLGGKRAWWLCPGCGKRVAILYLKNNIFRCRACHDLTYRSSQESRLDRHLRKKFKVCDKLHIGPTDKPLFKPKFMHQKTFDRLRRQHTLANKSTLLDLIIQLERLNTHQ